MDFRLRALAELQAGAFTATDAARVDIGASALRSLTKRSSIVRLRRGAYVLADMWEAASPEERLALRTRAVLLARDVGPASQAGTGDSGEEVDEPAEADPPVPDAASHQSALAVYALPLHGVRLDVVDLISGVNRVRLAAGLRTQPGNHPTVTVAGVHCVTMPVAIAQVLMRSGLLAALVPLDSALLTKKCSIDDVSTALDAVCGANAAIGQRLLELADSKSESVGETRTRLLLHDLGFTPRSQICIHDEWGAFVARVDFLVGTRIVAEFDGLVKYEGADGKAALAKEKRREDRMRALTFVVVRLTWADLDRPERVAQLLQRAVAQVARSAC